MLLHSRQSGGVSKVRLIEDELSIWNYQRAPKGQKLIAQGIALPFVHIFYVSINEMISVKNARIHYTKQSIFETTLYKKQEDICQKLMFQKMCTKGRAMPWAMGLLGLQPVRFLTIYNFSECAFYFWQTHWNPEGFAPSVGLFRFLSKPCNTCLKDVYKG